MNCHVVRIFSTLIRRLLVSRASVALICFALFEASCDNDSFPDASASCNKKIHLSKYVRDRSHCSSDSDCVPALEVKSEGCSFSWIEIGHAGSSGEILAIRAEEAKKSDFVDFSSALMDKCCGSFFYREGNGWLCVNLVDAADVDLEAKCVEGTCKGFLRASEESCPEFERTMDAGIPRYSDSGARRDSASNTDKRKDSSIIHDATYED
jgi:hypothetical protein